MSQVIHYYILPFPSFTKKQVKKLLLFLNIPYLTYKWHSSQNLLIIPSSPPFPQKQYHQIFSVLSPKFLVSPAPPLDLYSHCPSWFNNFFLHYCLLKCLCAFCPTVLWKHPLHVHQIMYNISAFHKIIWWLSLIFRLNLNPAWLQKFSLVRHLFTAFNYYL